VMDVREARREAHGFAAAVIRQANEAGPGVDGWSEDEAEHVMISEEMTRLAEWHVKLARR
jgi:hypothetical protein